MTFDETMEKLRELGTQRTKKIYISNGAREPLFGVASGEMKPLSKIINKDQELALKLYKTGNYDAMYFAGMICDPDLMTEKIFDEWITEAYFYMLSEFVVAVSLAETNIAQKIADKWLNSNEELWISAGWSCYEWLLGWRPDIFFEKDKINSMLNYIIENIHSVSGRVCYTMKNFVIAVGVSYIPLHEKAVETADKIGKIDFISPKGKCSAPNAAEAIQKMINRNKIGFKRKSVRC